METSARAVVRTSTLSLSVQPGLAGRLGHKSKCDKGNRHWIAFYELDLELR